MLTILKKEGFLLALWLLSLWYTIFYWPIGPPFGTLLSSTCQMAIPMVHLVSSTGTLAITLVIIKSLDPLRAKKTFIRKKLGYTMV